MGNLITVIHFMDDTFGITLSFTLLVTLICLLLDLVFSISERRNK